MAISAPAVRHQATRALVTGGGQGVGLAIARQLVAEGCRSLAIVGLDADVVQAAAEELRGSGATVLPMARDVSQFANCGAIVAETIEGLGGVNVLVNAAATSARGTLTEMGETVFDAIFATNVKAPYFLMQGVVRHALAASEPASILNILSVAAHAGAPHLSAYAASKGALATLTRNTAAAYRTNHIRCNGILPGWMDTPGEDDVQKKWHGAGDDWLQKVEASRPFGQIVKTDQLAILASYVLSPDAGVMTGSLIDYDQTVLMMA